MMHYDTITLTGTADTDYSKTAVGTLRYMKLTYTNGDAGGDVVVSDDQTGLVYTTLTDKNAAVAGCPKAPVLDLVGVAIANVYVDMPVVSRFKAVSAQQAANTSILIQVWWES